MAKSAMQLKSAVARAVILAFGLLGASCTVQQQETPGLAGPSEFALSVLVAATPDTVTQDGVSQSAIVVSAKDANGKPFGGVPFRIDMEVGGVTQDFGTLSARSIVTGLDGRAFATYTAPPPPPAFVGGSGTTLSIVATAMGSNYQVSLSHVADIRLVPPGVILPPSGTPTASFTFPTPVSINVGTLFDASGSTPGTAANSITSYSWNFGDGGSGSGKTALHVFTTTGTYSVTLTVTNDRGLAASSTQTVGVGVSAAPVATFVVSPTDSPAINQTVFFNADGSRASPGRSIIQYSWNWGDGTGEDGTYLAQHAWSAPGTYTVVLTIRDDADQKSTVSVTVTVSSGKPLASFTASPTAAPHSMTFDGSASTAVGTSTIASYQWAFGDGNFGGPSASPTITYTYAAAGTYTVRLTVTDSQGRTGVTSQSVTVP